MSNFESLKSSIVWVGNAAADFRMFVRINRFIVDESNPNADRIAALKLIDEGMGVESGEPTQADLDSYLEEME